jgi:hypothetical protein
MSRIEPGIGIQAGSYGRPIASLSRIQTTAKQRKVHEVNKVIRLKSTRVLLISLVVLLGALNVQNAWAQG